MNSSDENGGPIIRGFIFSLIYAEYIAEPRKIIIKADLHSLFENYRN